MTRCLAFSAAAGFAHGVCSASNTFKFNCMPPRTYSTTVDKISPPPTLRLPCQMEGCGPNNGRLLHTAPCILLHAHCFVLRSQHRSPGEPWPTKLLLTSVIIAGMALATMFVTLPFVVRELIPILETMDLSQASGSSWLRRQDCSMKAGCTPFHTSSMSSVCSSTCDQPSLASCIVVGSPPVGRGGEVAWRQ